MPTCMRSPLDESRSGAGAAKWQPWGVELRLKAVYWSQIDSGTGGVVLNANACLTMGSIYTNRGDSDRIARVFTLDCTERTKLVVPYLNITTTGE